jgi:hypothetical protein
MVESGERSARDWTVLWELAISMTRERPAFQGVYTGPAWETISSSTSTEVRVWKIAVLMRRPGAGAEHWGHVFLVMGTGTPTISIRPAGGIAGDADRLELETLPGVPGAPLRIQIRPTAPETRDRLREFALEFQRHAVAVAVD